jgi:hypothetical protein
VTEAQWLAATDPYRLTRHQAGRTERKRRLLSCALARGVLDLLPHGEAAAAVEAAERFADGRATEEELRAAAGVVGRLAAGRPHAGTLAAAALAAALSKPGVGTVHGLEPSAAARRGGWNGPVAARWQCDLAREIFGNPFRPVTTDPSWLTSTVVTLARQMYESRDFSPMPILADALQDAGCDHADILNHCRGGGVHVRGCWVVDLLLGKG